jgi:hypothetical protein
LEINRGYCSTGFNLAGPSKTACLPMGWWPNQREQGDGEQSSTHGGSVVAASQSGNRQQEEVGSRLREMIVRWCTDFWGGGEKGAHLESATRGGASWVELPIGEGLEGWSGLELEGTQRCTGAGWSLRRQRLHRMGTGGVWYRCLRSGGRRRWRWGRSGRSSWRTMAQ